MASNPEMKQTLIQIRIKLIDSMLLVSAILSLPALAFSLYRIKHTGWNHSFFIQIFAVLMVILFYIFRRHILFKIKALAILIIIFFLIISGYITYGLAGNGAGYLILLIALSTFFFGFRGGLLSLVISTLSLSILSFAVLNRFITFTIDFNIFNSALSSWASAISVIVLFGGIIVITADRLYSSLAKTLQESDSKNLILLQEISERKTAEETLTRKSSFDKIMTGIMARFAVAGFEDIESSIRESLRDIAGIIGADHAFIIIFSGDHWSVKYSWLLTGLPPDFKVPDSFPLGTIPWSEEQTFSGKVLNISRLEDFPPEAETDRNFHKAEGAKSILNIPMFQKDGGITGCIGLHSHAREVQWPQEGIEQLKMAGNAIAGLIERKKIEEALRESERKTRAIFNLSFEFTGLLTPEGEVIDANQRFLDFTNMTLAEAKGKPSWETAWFSESAESQARLKAAVKGAKEGIFARYEVTHTSKTGLLTVIDFSLKPIFDETNNVVMLLAEGRDITSRKTAEEALRSSEARLREAQRIAHIGSWELDLAQNKLTWSDEIYRIFQLERNNSSTTYEGFLNSVHPDDRETVDRAYRNSIESHMPYSVIHRILMPDGRIKHVHEQCETLYNADSRPIRSIGTVQDITDRILAEEEKEKLALRFQQIQKMESLGTLAAGIAHDFNNILSAIFGYTELASMKIESGKIEKTGEYLTEIRTAGLRAKDLVKQILAFSRQSGITREAVDIIPVVKETVKLLRASLPATIEIRQNIPESGYIIKSDPTQFHQILMNLCSNAAFAMQSKGGVINISLSQVTIDKNSAKQFGLASGGEYMRMTVTDTGCGIPADIISKIFDPFFTTKDRDKGTGMGLSVVHGIITDMEGAISVYSEIGKGSTFQILLPFIEGASPENTAGNEKLVRGRGRILMVDDEESIIYSGGAILRHLGYDVITANKASDAINIFRPSPGTFTCIITDLNMPGMSGMELAGELKKIRPDIPILLTTGFSPGITSEDLEKAGIDEIIMKPLIAIELSEALNRVISTTRNSTDK